MSDIQRQNDIISASLLSANLAAMGDDAKAVLEAGADCLHFDVMDFHYVPNLSFGPSMCKALRATGMKATIDVHLMVENPEKYVQPFAEAGADYLLFHPQTCHDVADLIRQIKEANMRPGLVYNPDEALSQAAELWPQVDVILIMTVIPGFGGQSLLAECLDKVSKARDIIKNTELSCHLAVDGGITTDNIAACKDAGANWFVSGSAIFKSTQGYAEEINNMRQQLALVQKNPSVDADKK